MARKLLWASLALGPATILINYLTDVGDVTLFVLAALSLIPLAWLIGEATEHAAEHTGAGIGGFLNASFGNAPELIIALFAVADNLPGVVRGSLSGSVISNLLLVLGVAMLAGGRGELDRRSLLLQIGLVAFAVVALIGPSVLGYQGDPERDLAVDASIPVAVVLLLVYLAVTIGNLRRHHEMPHAEPMTGAWSLPVALVVLGVTTAVTAIVSEIMVHSLSAFAEAVGLSEFFIAAVIVAIVGNAAEHGGAIVIAYRGKMKLASEIAISSAAQVGLLVTPVVMLLSLLFAHPLPLTFRWIELTAMAGAVMLVAAMAVDGRSRRWEGGVLVAAYAGVVIGFLLAGDRG